MAKTLRRSRRATKKGVSDYNVGDIVEVSPFGCDLRCIRQSTRNDDFKTNSAVIKNSVITNLD